MHSTLLSAIVFMEYFAVKCIMHDKILHMWTFNNSTIMSTNLYNLFVKLRVFNWFLSYFHQQPFPMGPEGAMGQMGQDMPPVMNGMSHPVDVHWCS